MRTDPQHLKIIAQSGSATEMTNALMQAAAYISELEQRKPVLWQYRTRDMDEDWTVSFGKPDHVSDRDYEKRPLVAGPST